MNKPVIAHSITVYLFLTGSWIYNQIINLQRYRPIVLCNRTENKQFFPLNEVYSLSDFSFLVKTYHRAIRKIFRSYYPFYEKIIERYGVELLHSHFGDVAFGDLSLKQQLRLPQVATFYGYDVSMLPQRKHWPKRFERLFEDCDLLLVEGAHMKRCLERIGCPSKKIIVQHLGVDTEKIEFFPRILDKGDKIRIIMVGGFLEKKGIPYGLEAFGKIKEKYKNVELILVGGFTNHTRYGNEPARIKQTISKYRLDSCVKILGFLPYSRYLEEAKSAHIFLCPSVTASDGDTEGGAPVTLIEAEAMGMPDIASYHADIPEVVMDNKSGFMVKEKDVEALAERLDFLLQNPDIWPIMGKEGRQHVEKEFNLKIQVDRLERIYDSLLGR